MYVESPLNLPLMIVLSIKFGVNFLIASLIQLHNVDAFQVAMHPSFSLVTSCDMVCLSAKRRYQPESHFGGVIVM